MAKAQTESELGRKPSISSAISRSQPSPRRGLGYRHFVEGNRARRADAIKKMNGGGQRAIAQEAEWPPAGILCFRSDEHSFRRHWAKIVRVIARELGTWLPQNIPFSASRACEPRTHKNAELTSVHSGGLLGNAQPTTTSFCRRRWLDSSRRSVRLPLPSLFRRHLSRPW